MICFLLHIAGTLIVSARCSIYISYISAWFCLCVSIIHVIVVYVSIPKFCASFVVTDFVVSIDRMVLDFRLSP